MTPEELKAARLRAGLNNVMMSAMLGYYDPRGTTITRMENGRMKIPPTVPLMIEFLDKMLPKRIKDNDEFRAAMDEMKLSATQVAKLLGMSRNTVMLCRNKYKISARVGMAMAWLHKMWRDHPEFLADKIADIKREERTNRELAEIDRLDQRLAALKENPAGSVDGLLSGGAKGGASLSSVSEPPGTVGSNPTAGAGRGLIQMSEGR